MAAEKTSGDTGKMIYKQFDFKVKALTEDKDNHYFEGYLSTYGNIDRVGEVMDKGCFDESLKELVPMLLWQHKSTEVVGVFTEFSSDDTGLFVKGKMPKSDTLVSGRIFPQMQVGSVRSMSVGFIPEEWDYKEDVKHHVKVMLVEGSLVAFPANPKAQITNIKSFTIEDVEEIKTKRDYEKLHVGAGDLLLFNRNDLAHAMRRVDDIVIGVKIHAFLRLNHYYSFLFLWSADKSEPKKPIPVTIDIREVWFGSD